MILRAQSSDGGWGPHPMAAAEPFDTAVVLLALREPAAVARGRAFLIARQRPDGGWPETTRPPGAQSYAQHISTSAWATLSLLADVEPYQDRLPSQTFGDSLKWSDVRCADS